MYFSDCKIRHISDDLVLPIEVFMLTSFVEWSNHKAAAILETVLRKTHTLSPIYPGEAPTFMGK